MIFWIANLIVIGLTSMLFSKTCRGDFHPIIFWTSLSMKLTAGLVVGWIFLHQYAGADTFMYFKKAQELVNQPTQAYISELFKSSNYEVTNKPRVLFFTKILSPFTLISGGSYWICSLYLSLISFFASWWTAVRIHKIYPDYGLITISCFLFIPTIVFWSSGILKDTITSSVMLIAITSVITLHRTKQLSTLEILWTTLSIFVLFKLKHYILISFLLFSGLLYFLHYIKQSNIRGKIAATIVLVVSLFGTQFVHPYLHFHRFPLTIYENNRAIIQKTNSEDQLNIEIEDPSWKSVLSQTPEAIKTGLFRPSVFDYTAPFGWLHKVENLLLTFLTILSILIWLKERPEVDISLTTASIFSILLLATMLALSTPNFGTLVRYKNVFMPFFFLLVSILPYEYLSLKKPQ